MFAKGWWEQRGAEIRSREQQQKGRRRRQARTAGAREARLCRGGPLAPGRASQPAKRWLASAVHRMVYRMAPADSTSIMLYSRCSAPALTCGAAAGAGRRGEWVRAEREDSGCGLGGRQRRARPHAPPSVSCQAPGQPHLTVQVKAGAEQRLYNMIDVLSAGAMR